MKLTESELELMEVLWNAKAPLTGKQIIEESENKTWKDSSIHILLNSLLKKEAIQEIGFVRSGKGYSRTFEPTDSGKQYYADFLGNIANKTSVSMLFSALTSSETISKKTLDELEQMINAKKMELEK